MKGFIVLLVLFMAYCAGCVYMDAATETRRMRETRGYQQWRRMGCPGHPVVPRYEETSDE